MQVQITDPDEFEKDIDNEFHRLDGTPTGMGCPWWPQEVKNAVGRIAKQRDYSVYATGMGAEWLYDLICIEYEDKCLKGIPLVLESEWREGGVDADFQKLVVARAYHRVMVMCVTSNENKEEERLINELLQHVKKCQHSGVGDRYMFACFDEKKRNFNCSVYKVVKLSEVRSLLSGVLK
jgi:hypothetical protein